MTVVAAGAGPDRVGLTVSSLLVVQGDEPQVVILVDPLSDLGEALAEGTRCTVSVLTAGDALIAETFAGAAPAPGGPFTVGHWLDTEFGPVLQGRSWLGAEVTRISPLGWSLQVIARIERVVLVDAPVLIHQRGAYRT